MTSIRRFVTFWLLLGIGAAVIGAAVMSYVIARRGLEREFDRALAGKARALGTLIEQDARGTSMDFSGEVMPEFEREENPEYFQIWLDDGRLFGRSDTLGEHDLAKRTGPDGGPIGWDLDLPDGRPGRAVGLAVPIVRREGDDDDESDGAEGYTAGARWPKSATFVVARSRESLIEAGHSLIVGLAGGVLVSCVAIVLVVALTVRLGLAPLLGLGRDVDRIDARTLSSRLPTAGQPREVAPLSVKLNELLARLEGSFQRERRMTAAMAHELRTPVAEIRSAADVARRWPGDASLQSDAVETAHEVSQHMGRIVDSLLKLSRAQAGREELEPEEIDISTVGETVWGQFQAQVREKALEVSSDSEPGLCASTDRGLMEVIVRNLVANAVSHTPRGGRIESRLENGGPDVTWTLTNSPVDLEEDDLDRLAEPLWRKEEARSDREHQGLGLTLASSVAAALGVTLEFGLEGQAFRATVRVPRALSA